MASATDPVTSIPMTPLGYRKLQAELRKLKSVDRPANVKDIEEARGHGDLSENAEYDAAKNRQGLIEARIREVEDCLGRAQVIDPATLKGTRVVFGATVHVYDIDTEAETTFRIVGEDEADLTKGWLSVTSPIARALIGKREGDEAEVKAPKGARTFEVVNIKFEPMPAIPDIETLISEMS